MTLGEQLAELRFNILRDRSDLIAGDRDSLWTDETLLEYIKDGERRFARQSLILRDGNTPEICTFNIAAPAAGETYGEKTYVLHPSILAVISAKYDNKFSDLIRSGHSLVVPAPPSEYMTYDKPAQFDLPPSDPVAFYTDETLVYASKNRVTLSIFPRPGADQGGKQIAMRVVRLPTTCYDKQHLDIESQIPEDYQLDVLEWAAYRAQRTWDGDAGAPTTSDAHKAAFDDAVVRAQKERQAMMFANVNFRYGRNGFTYTR